MFDAIHQIHLAAMGCSHKNTCEGAEQNCSFFMHKRRKKIRKEQRLGFSAYRWECAFLPHFQFAKSLIRLGIKPKRSKLKPTPPVRTKSLYNPLQKCYIVQSVPWTGSAEQNLWEEALIQQKVSVERDLFLCPSKFPLFPRTNQC